MSENIRKLLRKYDEEVRSLEDLEYTEKKLRELLERIEDTLSLFDMNFSNVEKL